MLYLEIQSVYLDLIMDRLNTKDMLYRRHWNVADGTSRVIGPTGTREDMDHLFFQCNFYDRVWNYLQICWQVGDVMRAIFVHAQKDFNKPLFAEVIFLACWNIWIYRNARILRNERPIFYRWKSGVVHEVSLPTHRIKHGHRDYLMRWVPYLPFFLLLRL